MTPIKAELAEKGFNIRFHTGIRYKNWKLLTGFHLMRDYDLEENHIAQHAHLVEEDPSLQLGKLVALFEMTKDYREFSDVSEENPEITRLLLNKV